ncbi:MAG: metal-dependent transcriptional regulator [Gemmatimonadetes bacterium]|nr:metal-dependent transcriptional regulator [Gemmatimonadota bacterium]MYG15989.1 metal-dependent transcriptional regulator [Gemmatimonadota bacterium]
MPTPATEDYLKTIYKLQENAETASTNAVADRMGVSAASVTNMMKRLSESGLVEHRPYQAIRLTDAGRKIALEIIRHHRLLEVYMAEALGFTWDQVDAEAERLEHVISEEFEDKIDAMLGYPTTDPHGSPIPTKDGSIATSNHEKLSDKEAGTTVVVRRVTDTDPELLRYLAKLGLRPESTVEVLNKEPFEGPMLLRIAGEEHHIGRQVARTVLVESLAAGEGSDDGRADP